MPTTASKTIGQPSKETQAEQSDSQSASARTLTAPDEAIVFEFDAAISSTVERKGSAPARPIQTEGPLSPEMLDKMHRYWQAANYLTVGQIYLQENPLLREPLQAEHIKPRLLGHWGTSAGLNFIYVHLNRLIKERGANVIYIAGPGHGGPALNANSYLEGTYTAVHPEVTQDARASGYYFANSPRQAAYPATAARMCQIRSTKAANLGYSLLHAFGAAFDNPELIVACVVGDGEAETCPLEGSWKSKFLNPMRDGAVLPILHLNGYKISGPTVEARTPTKNSTSSTEARIRALFRRRRRPGFVHQEFAAELSSSAIRKFSKFRTKARREMSPARRPPGR